MRVEPQSTSAYDVLVGSGVASRLSDYVGEGVRKIFVITQDNVPRVEVPLEVENTQRFVPDGESAKTLDVVGELLGEMSSFGLGRGDLVLAIGGGVVSDLAGFVASIYLRGVRYMTVSSTLLGQIDAAIGGKTGVNLPTGKNLVGSFWHPSSVFCDTSLLNSLSEREFKSGLGEMVKYEFLGASGLTLDALDESIAKCVAIKADFVKEDEREGGRRALLNYGHTFGHALESLGIAGAIDRITHGEAVAKGIRFAAHLAHRLGRITDRELDHHYQVLSEFSLDISIPEKVTIEDVMPYIARDKKNRGSITFVLAQSDGEPSVMRGISEGDLHCALKSLHQYL
ncbi:MAG: 3-dehydroquinate synthase [Actinomycetota bacterium]|nr:3-dehydroquinate synthase [Actinomycetota bacterium]